MSPSQEQSVYEQLQDIPTLRGLVTAAVNIFDHDVDQLMQRVFRKTDFAVKSVVDSLLGSHGPLAELNVRLKVLLGLGVLETATFHDIEHYLALKVRLNNESQEYALSSALTLEFLQQLHSVQDKAMLLKLEKELQLTASGVQDNKDSLLLQVKTLRSEKILRSYLLLSISTLCEQLQIESPL
ncbi:MltR family transcriptional regulator [Testudinibacter sp. TR-2022]|uniref:MltR family transcriptional regulator n=1 Tax=Testudinibacter sp. TR-2022 TaxID=2585029 RepID=UPI001117B4F7|nr:MltR family transcriptional regulator [Testudinibacter sp. TR-2022]TNH07436.1 MltR family transcriptional regulator [Pasteurellaceae bacterium Phil11]TNH24025.1 MltR family transcriptional regulator [Testudinibacter sp. TR-2022]TNH27183.1 MltR family transcriptional regulator [Testudinibacter sp. TR-2022]